jgi:hypothetical protein
VAFGSLQEAAGTVAGLITQPAGSALTFSMANASQQTLESSLENSGKSSISPHFFISETSGRLRFLDLNGFVSKLSYNCNA